MSNRLWALTTYFNPVGFSTRYYNYQTFRARLPVPLATIELTFNDQYELNHEDADIMVQCGSGDLMWQKERLINKLVKSLPDECEYVLIIDADVIFPDNNWIDRVLKSLDQYKLLQPFDKSYRLLPYGLPGSNHGVNPTARLGFAHGIDMSTRPETGIVWAIHRDILEKDGLYDASIVGGGDALMIMAALNKEKLAAGRQSMNAHSAAHYFEWAERFYKSIGNKVGWIGGDVYTLWHGSQVNRQYINRYMILKNNDYNPEEDIALNADDVWQWSSDKPVLHQSLLDYFKQRREDSKIVTFQDKQGGSGSFLQV